MNLDLTNGGLHFGSRSQDFWCQEFYLFFSPRFAFPSLVNQVLSHEVRCYQLLHTDSSKPIRTSHPVRRSLSPNQFVQLCDNHPVIPDPYRNRFGLRSNQLTAVQRAHDFMNWRQERFEPVKDGHIHQKKLLCALSRSRRWGT